MMISLGNSFSVFTEKSNYGLKFQTKFKTIMLNCVPLCTQLEEKAMLEKIGIREFRNNLAKYISATEPIAVMRHGQTVGYFLPTHKKPEQAELESLMQAAEKLDRLLAEKGITEDELVEEFRQLRRGDN